MLIFLAVFLASLVILAVIASSFPALRQSRGNAALPTPMIAMEVVFIGATLAATLVMSLIERRSILSYWLRDSNPWPKLFKGMVAGFLAIFALVGILYSARLLVFDRVVLSGPSILGYGLVWGLCFILVGIAEETAFRGYMHFTFTRGMNFFWASILTSSLFFAAHMGNGGENWIGLALVFAAGAFFCLALRLTGSLYWPIGFHAAWDWSQNYLFGTADSGLITQGRLLATHPQGNPMWSGGADGPEGSLYALLILVVASGLLWIFCRKNAPPTMGAAIGAELPPSPPAEDLAYATPA